MNNFDEKVNALFEVTKDFGRWAISFFIGWVLDNGYSFFAGSRLDPQTIFFIGIGFKYLDFAWHKYRKDVGYDDPGKSLGIIPF